jgi:CRP-like cAMP-binding protein
LVGYVSFFAFVLCFDSFSFRLSPSPEIERAFQTVRLFETFYSSEINLLARAIETVHFNDKECVYRQGDPGDYYYLILKGRVDCQMQVCVVFRCL